MPDNHNDQARAHSQARESAEDRSKKTRGEVLPKKPGHPQLPEINSFQKVLDRGIIGCLYYYPAGMRASRFCQQVENASLLRDGKNHCEKQARWGRLPPGCLRMIASPPPDAQEHRFPGKSLLCD